MRVQLHSFIYGYPVAPASFLGKTILSSLSDLGTLVENQLTIDLYSYFWTLDSIPLIYMCTLVQASHCLDYCCVVAL